QTPEPRALAHRTVAARALQDAPPTERRISRYQAGLWDELAGLGVADHQAAAWQEQVDGLLSAEGVGSAEPPAMLRANLRRYQEEGFAWLAFLWKHRLRGILAADIGIGKTMQGLPLIGHGQHEHRRDGSVM